MGKKLVKQEILDEILKKISVVSEYQKRDPDPTAKTRIERMEADPCGEVRYYVNVSLSDVKSEDSTDLAERKKYSEQGKATPTLEEINSFFEVGANITIELSDDGKYTINSEEASSFQDCFDFIKNEYIQGSYVRTLSPKTPNDGDNFLKEDCETALASGYKKIVYSIGRFSIPAIESWMRNYFGDSMSLLDWSIGMEEVRYVDMTKVTSFESNVNQFLGVNAINPVTMFLSKNQLPTWDLKEKHKVYDIGLFVSNVISDVKTSDKSLASQKIDKWSEGCFNDLDTARYNEYLLNGGNSSWSSWTAATSNYLTWKSLAGSDPEFKGLGENNENFMKNVSAYQAALDTYANNDYECINTYWKKDSTKFPYKRAASGSGADNLVDPPNVYVTPCNGETSLKFDETVERHYVVNDLKNEVRKEGTYESTNNISVKREKVKVRRKRVYLCAN